MSKIKIFISHASEDKESIASALAYALRRYNIDVWYDEFSLTVGDSLTESISKGLANCDYGLVILSRNFFSKNWTKKELNGLRSRAYSGDKNIILPIWHEITYEYIAKIDPILADIFALDSSLKTDDLVKKILDKVYESTNLDERAPTGLSTLDRILGGGIRRGSSIVIEGPKGIGKTTLGLQIQKEALKRGESCLFIAYSEMPCEIINQFYRLGCDIEKYIFADKFKILDSYSALNGISQKESFLNLSDEMKKSIVRVDNPYDVENYYNLQVDVMNSIGSPGVNVIDSTNKRYELFETQKENTKMHEKYFNRFKSRLGRISNNIGIHIVTDLDHHKELLSLLGNLEDGVIRLKYSNDPIHGRLRYLQVENIDYCDTSWYEFSLNENGINIF